MPAITTVIAAVGLGLAATGTAVNYIGQQRAASAQNAAFEKQQQAEALRAKQMELEANRRKREMLRQQMLARSTALATVTAQGAGAPGSSALPGAEGEISGRTNENMLGTNQNLEIGRNMFSLNSSILGDYRSAAEASSFAAFGSGLTSLGGAMMMQSEKIGKIGDYTFSRFFGSPRGYGDFGEQPGVYG